MSKYLNKEGLQRLWEHITSELGSKVDKVTGKGLSTNDYTTDEKAKLSKIEEGANKTVADTELLSGSTNPVQNKVVTARISTIQTAITSINNNKAADFTNLDDIHYPTTKAVSTKMSEDIASSTADWDENDDSNTDYVKNRTHYRRLTGVSLGGLQSLALQEYPLQFGPDSQTESNIYPYTQSTTEFPFNTTTLQSASYFTLKYKLTSSASEYLTDTGYLEVTTIKDSSTATTTDVLGITFSTAQIVICFSVNDSTSFWMSRRQQTWGPMDLIAQNVGIMKKLDANYLPTMSVPTLSTARYIDGIKFDGSSDIYHTMVSAVNANTVEKTVYNKVPLPKISRGICFLYLTKGNTVTDGIYIKYDVGGDVAQIYYNNQPLTGDIAKFEAHSVLPLVYYGSHWNVVGKLPDITSSSEITIDDGSID